MSKRKQEDLEVPQPKKARVEEEAVKPAVEPDEDSNEESFDEAGEDSNEEYGGESSEEIPAAILEQFDDSDDSDEDGGDWSGFGGYRCSVCGRRSDNVGPRRGFDYRTSTCGGCTDL